MTEMTKKTTDKLTHISKGGKNGNYLLIKW